MVPAEVWLIVVWDRSREGKATRAHTCTVWARRALKHIGLQTCNITVYWTSVTWHLQPANCNQSGAFVRRSYIANEFMQSVWLLLLSARPPVTHSSACCSSWPWPRESRDATSAFKHCVQPCTPAATAIADSLCLQYQTVELPVTAGWMPKWYWLKNKALSTI